MSLLKYPTTGQRFSLFSWEASKMFGNNIQTYGETRESKEAWELKTSIKQV